MTAIHIMLILGLLLAVAGVVLLILGRAQTDGKIKLPGGFEVSGATSLILIVFGTVTAGYTLFRGPADSQCVVFCETAFRSGWAYYGNRVGSGEWQTQNFTVIDSSNRLPKYGDIVNTQTLTNIREQPISTSVGVLSPSVVGQAKEGERFRVKAVDETKPGFYWVWLQKL